MCRIDYSGEAWDYVDSFGQGLLMCSCIAAGFALGVAAVAVTISTCGVGTVAVVAAYATTAKALAIPSITLGVWGAGAILTEEIGESIVDAILQQDPDPYKRPGQKKQGRERKEEKKKSNKWKPNPNKRVKPLPKHTPGRDHRKY